MTRFKLVFLFAIIYLIFSIASNARAYRFEDYKWGSDIADIESALRQKNMNIMAGKRAIMAKKEVHGIRAAIEFLFTHKSLKLYCVTVRFEGDCFDRMRNNLIKEYGFPECAETPAKDCFWRDNISFIRLTKRRFDTVILYGDKHWHKIHEKEKN